MTLKSICEVAWRQLFPNPGDETGITREEVIESGKVFYSRAVWALSKTEKNTEGVFTIPSHLLTETELDVVDNEMDISSLKIMRSLSSDTWLQNVGGLVCDCTYVGSNVNMTQLLCDDEFQDGTKTYIVVGNRIKFPQGAHKDKVKIIYASDGTDVDIDEALGATVREQLINLYARKGTDDTTNNNNPNI